MAAKTDDKLVKILLKQIRAVKSFVSDAEKRSTLIIKNPPIGPWPKRLLQTLIKLEKQLLKTIGKLEKRVEALKKPARRPAKKRARAKAAT